MSRVILIREGESGSKVRQMGVFLVLPIVLPIVLILIVFFKKNGTMHLLDQKRCIVPVFIILRIS
jgi:hypothetical protein